MITGATIAANIAIVMIVCVMCLLYQIRPTLSSLVFELLVPDSADVLFFANVVDHVSGVLDLWCEWDGLGD
jgi:hypothetical protein